MVKEPIEKVLVVLDKAGQCLGIVVTFLGSGRGFGHASECICEDRPSKGPFLLALCEDRWAAGGFGEIGRDDVCASAFAWRLEP